MNDDTEKLLHEFLMLAGQLGFHLVSVWKPDSDPDGQQPEGTVLAVHFARDELTMTRSMMEYLIENRVNEA